MRKYGIEHFHISLLEETKFPEEREQYWIKALDSYRNGYNATKGGDGKRYLDYDLICSTYNKVKNCVETARLLEVDEKTIRSVLKQNNIETMH